MCVLTQLNKVLTFAIIGIFSLPTQVMSETKLSFQPVFYVEEENLARFVTAVGLVFSLRSPDAFYFQDPRKANFVFVSITGLIVGRKINRKYLDMFDEGVRAEIVSQPSDSDECYVQQFTTSAGRTFVLALNEPNNGPTEEDQKCFLLALSFYDDFKFADQDEFNRLDVPKLTSLVLDRLSTE